MRRPICLPVKGAVPCDVRSSNLGELFPRIAPQGTAPFIELATAMGHRTLSILQRYTDLDVQVTKKLGKNISEKILKGVSQIAEIAELQA